MIKSARYCEAVILAPRSLHRKTSLGLADTSKMMRATDCGDTRSGEAMKPKAVASHLGRVFAMTISSWFPQTRSVVS